MLNSSVGLFFNKLYLIPRLWGSIFEHYRSKFFETGKKKTQIVDHTLFSEPASQCFILEWWLSISFLFIFEKYRVRWIHIHFHASNRFSSFLILSLWVAFLRSSKGQPSNVRRVILFHRHFSSILKIKNGIEYRIKQFFNLNIYTAENYVS